MTYKHFCPHCNGIPESKGIRKERRRFRCSKCKKNLGSQLISDLEREQLRKKDKGIGNLTLTEREAELKGLNNPVYLDKKSRKTKYAPYALLPKYDPKWNK